MRGTGNRDPWPLEVRADVRHPYSAVPSADAHTLRSQSPVMQAPRKDLYSWDNHGTLAIFLLIRDTRDKSALRTLKIILNAPRQPNAPPQTFATDPGGAAIMSGTLTANVIPDSLCFREPYEYIQETAWLVVSLCAAIKVLSL